METMGETKKRNSEEETTQAKKSRRNGSGAVEYLKERADQELAFKGKELELKKRENERLESLQTPETQMFKAMMDQQQQQTQALMSIIEKLVR